MLVLVDSFRLNSHHKVSDIKVRVYQYYSFIFKSPQSVL